MPAILYTYEDLRKLGITFTPQYLWRLEKRGEFPKRRKLNPLSGNRYGSVGWVASEIDAHLSLVAA